VSLHLPILLLVCPSVFLAFNISVLLSFYVGACLSFYLFVQANQKGINAHPKSTRANPHEWRACVWLGLALYLSANSEQVIEREGFLFSKPK
jgi:hypothetical protein